MRWKLVLIILKLILKSYYLLNWKTMHNCSKFTNSQIIINCNITNPDITFLFYFIVHLILYY